MNRVLVVVVVCVCVWGGGDEVDEEALCVPDELLRTAAPHTLRCTMRCTEPSKGPRTRETERESVRLQKLYRALTI